MDNSCGMAGRWIEKARLKKSYMVMQMNYELFADSVEAECSFGIRNPDQKELVTETLEKLGLLLTGNGTRTPCQAVKNSGGCGGQYDLRKNLLVFDEPTSGLILTVWRHRWQGLIRRLSDMGKVILIVTHDFEFVCRTCSRSAF